MDVFFKQLPQDYNFCKTTVLSFTAITILFSIVIKLTSLPTSSKTSLIPKLPSVPVLGAFYPLIWQNFRELFTSWLSRYGPTFRTNVMGTEFVLLSNPKWLQKLFTSSDAGHISKCSMIYNIVFPWFLSGGLGSQSNIKSKIKVTPKSILSKAFSSESLKADLTMLNRHAKQLIDKMKEIRFEDNGIVREEANSSSTLHAKLHDSCYRTAAEICGGLNKLSSEEELEITEKFSRCEDIVSYRFYHPWCLIETIWNFVPQKKEMETIAKSITKIIEKLGNSARANMNTERSVKTLLDLMIEDGFNNNEIVTQLANFAIAAYDTQSVGISYFLFLMALHPEHQKKCQDEIDEIFETSSKNSNVTNGQLAWDDLAQMKYLEMCIKESLRMFTPIPAIARGLETPLKLEEDLILDKGTVVIVSPSLIHRDPQVWPDPTVYNPERFLPENCKTRSAYSYIPFSKGIRDCIAQRLSNIHFKLTVAYILRSYQLYPGNPNDNLSKVWDSAIWPAKDLGVRWRKRAYVL